MDCSGCKIQLAGLEEVVFLIKGVKDVTFTLAPECRDLVVERSLKIGDFDPKKKRKDVNCQNCNWDLGKETKFGPGGTTLVAFGTEKVIVLGIQLRKKDQWHAEVTTERYSSIQKRGENDFFQTENSVINEVVYKCPTLPDLRFPRQIEDFTWNHLLLLNKPRDYQIKCYLEGLQRDLVAVLSTGSGKTLIACLILKRMMLLNPERMGLFIVDRVPLVYQQAKVIAKETGLRVVGIEGENKTTKMLNGLHNDSYDVLVCTAGMFWALYENDRIFFKMFSCVVFDEAHHCTGAHVYKKILNELNLMPTNAKPRILGLTASPIDGDTIFKARTSLEKLKADFKTTAVYYPNIGTVATSPEYFVYRFTQKQRDFMTDVIASCNSIIKMINSSLSDHQKDYQLFNIDRNIDKYSQIKGGINALKELMDSPKRKELCKLLEILLETQEITLSMGLKFASDILNQPEIRNKLSPHFPVEKYMVEEELSENLENLENLIDMCSEDPRIIVFVETRECASRLKKHLGDRYSRYKPSLAVGHGGHDGQHWVGFQEKIIKDFHSGECKLLVATSVLEEGIDVSECDLVIRYSGVVTLIQFIQSRGRARKESSRFVVCVHEEKSKDAQNMELYEKNMDFVLSEHNEKENVFSQKSQDLYDHFLGDITLEDTDREDYIPEYYIQTDAVIEFFICIRNRFKKDDILEELEESLEGYGFDVKRIVLQEGQARQSSSQVFGWKDLKVLIELELEGDGKIFKLIQNVFSAWRFQLGQEKLPVFAKVKVKEPSDYKYSWDLSSIQCGVLKERQTFVHRYRLNNDMEDMELVFSMTGKLIQVKFSEGGEKYEMKLSLLKTSCLGFALCSWGQNECQLFIPIENMPILYEITEGPFGRLTSSRATSHQILTSLARFPVLSLKISIPSTKDGLLLREILNNSYVFPLSTYDTRVTNLMDVENQDIECNIVIPSNFEHKKALLEDEWEILIKSSDLSLHLDISDVNKYTEKIRTAYLEGNLSQAKQLSAAVRLATREGKTYWDSYGDIIEEKLLMIQKTDKDGDFADFTKHSLAKNQISVLRLVVTPSRYYFPPSVPMATSRLSRMLTKNQCQTIVTFRDENLDKMETSPDVISRIRHNLINGINLNGRTFYYLGSSASQLREQKGIFLCAESREAVLELRRRIIPNPESFVIPAKYLSRLGLFGTSDISAGFMKLEMFEKIPDLKAKDGTLVTDGAGFIRESLAFKLFDKCEVASKPSAFQFRCRGLKGVLMVIPDSHKIFQERSSSILYRESQKKFESDHMEMGIVKEAKAHRVFLNRESITLLESMYLLNVGVQSIWNFPSTLIQNQDKFLEETAKMFENNDGAESELCNYMPSDMLASVKKCFDITGEPFFFRLLRCAHKITITDLCRRANLHIEDGCLIMGIPDYTGKLATNQVFLKMSKDEREPRVITGPVIIYRNPCLYPGDIRLVEAIDVPELHYSKNVLVLPAENSDSSLSGHCSGGDLDGDQFSVIWDKQYIPPAKLIQEPLDYESLDGNDPIELVDATSPEALADCFISCMENDSIGRVAHMHLALSDYVDKGAMDNLCKELAKSQAVAVDFPKTGKRPKVPEKALETVKREGYPDFMEKKGTSYPSKKVLGDLYRDCKSFLFTYDLEEEDQKKIPYDQAMELQISPKVLKKAESVYAFYILEMRKIMHQFSLRQEEEVVLGRAVSWHPLLNSDRDRSSLHLKAAYYALKKRFYQIFKESPQDQVMEWAAAWYRVAYDQNKEYKDRPFLSFPWIAYEFLCKIKGSRNKLPEVLDSNIIKELGQSSLEVLYAESTVEDFNLDFLRKRLVQKQTVLKRVSDQIARKWGDDMFELRPYGSASMLLCEEDSDLDICVRILPKAYETARKKLPENEIDQSRHFLRIYISCAVEDLLTEKIDLIGNDVPLIKGEIDGHIKVDLSCNLSGLMKTKYILSLFYTDVAYFVTFWILIRWARFSGLIKFLALNIDSSVLETASLYALIIDLLETPAGNRLDLPDNVESLTMPEILDDMKLRLGEEIKNSENVLDRVGKNLYRFFRQGQSLKGDQVLVWPVDGLNDVLICSEDTAVFRKRCAQALHVLLYTRSITQLLANASEHTITATVILKKLSPSLSNVIRLGKEFHERRLSSLSKAKVSLTDDPLCHNLVFRAEGPRRAIAEALKELTSMNNNNKAFTIGVPTKKASRYFIQGSTMMMVRSSEDLNCRIGFHDTPGNCQPPHKIHQRSSPVIISETLNEESKWISELCVPELSSKLKCQLDTLPLDKDKVVKSLEATIRFGCAYIIDIESRLPRTQVSMSLDELVVGIEKGKSMRRTWERDFPKVRKQKESPQKIPMVELKKSRGMKIMEGKGKGVLKSEGEKRRGVAMSFLPGNLNPDNKNILQQLDSAAEVYEETLVSLGYTVCTPDQTGMSRIMNTAYWVLNVTAATGFELQLILDENFEFYELKERNLSYVHSTFFHGKKMDIEDSSRILIPETDIRFIVQTSDQAIPNSNLFKIVFPDGDTTNLPVELDPAGKPRIKDDIDEELKKAILLAKHSKNIKIFKKDDITASIISGKFYAGDRLADDRGYCDLSLYFKPEHIIQAIHDHDKMDVLAKQYITESIEVSNELEKRIKKLNKKYSQEKFNS